MFTLRKESKIICFCFISTVLYSLTIQLKYSDAFVLNEQAGMKCTTCRYVTRLKLLQDPLLTLSGQSLTFLNFFQDPDVTFGSIATSLTLLKSLPKYLALSYAASPTLSQSNLIHANSLARNIPKFCSVILLFASVIATLLKLYNANSSDLAFFKKELFFPASHSQSLLPARTQNFP